MLGCSSEALLSLEHAIARQELRKLVTMHRVMKPPFVGSAMFRLLQYGLAGGQRNRDHAPEKALPSVATQPRPGLADTRRVVRGAPGARIVATGSLDAW